MMEYCMTPLSGPVAQWLSGPVVSGTVTRTRWPLSHWVTVPLNGPLPTASLTTVPLNCGIIGLGHHG